MEPVFPKPVPEVLFLAVPPERPASLSPSVADAVSVSRSDVTRRVYAAQWVGFVAWADGVGVSWLSAYTHDVAQYLTDLIAGGAGLSTVRQAVSAIGAAHRAAGAASPTESELVRLTVAGVSGRNRRAAVQAPALLDDSVEAILATARLSRATVPPRHGESGAGSPGWRVDIALVLRDCGLRRAEAAALSWSDIERWDDDSGRLLIGRSKTGQTGEGEVVFITRRAMIALDELRQLRCDASPSVFGLVDQSINRRVKVAAKAAGLGRGVQRS